MEFKLTPWDSKLFGKEVYEIDGNVSFEELKNFEENNKDLFMLFTKIDISDIKKIHAYEKCGFNFIESQISIDINMRKKFEIRVPKDLVLGKIKNSDIDEIMYIVKNSFDTDRFYIDPLIDKKMSGKRYENWFKNNIDNSDYDYYKIYSKKTSKILGFQMVINGNPSYLALGGIHPDYKGKGLFAYLYTLLLNERFDKGEKKFVGAVSSLNIEIMNLNFYFGFKATDVKIVLRKIYS